MIINTYTDRKFLPHWLCLYKSLKEHCPSYTKYVWALCDESERILQRMDLPGVVIDSLARIEDDALKKTRGNRKWIEYVWTLPASFLLWMLQNFDTNAILHIDADCLLYGSLDPVLKEIGDASIAITPHRFSPENERLICFGRFNAGVIYVRNDTLGIACMQEWRDRCIEWCYWGEPDEEHQRATNQRYLDYWSQKYGAYAIQHKGFNLAPWNQAQYSLLQTDDRILVDRVELMLYHFHGTRITDEKQPWFKMSGYKDIQPFVRQVIEKPHIRRLKAAIQEVRKHE